MKRRGFTLAEILVSIMIFSVAGVAMVGTLVAATNLYRTTERARAAADEASAVLSAIQADVAAMCGPGERGFFYASVDSTTVNGSVNSSGNCRLAFKIMNPDRTQVSQTGAGSRKLVVWFVDGDTLKRGMVDAQDGGGTGTDEAVLVASAEAAAKPMTTGCLHLGVWLSGPGYRRLNQDWNAAWPTATQAVLTEGNPAEAFPEVLRITLVLTGGGRHTSQGTLVPLSGTTMEADDMQFRVAGIGPVSTVNGSLLRIQDEWIAYQGLTQGMIRVADSPAVGRGALRSTPAAHGRGDVVQAGQFFSLVMPLPR